MRKLLETLRARGVIRTVSYYLGLSWIAISAGDIVFPMVGLNESVLRFIVISVVAGLPLVVAGAWFFAADDVAVDDAAATAKSSADVMVVVLLAVVFVLTATYVYFDPDAIATDASNTLQRGSASDPRRVAVMEIRNRSEHESGEWLAGGLTEELRRQMGAWQEVEVLPGALTSGLTAQELSKSANVILDGYLIDDADGVKVTIDVIKTWETTAPVKLSASARWDEPKQLQQSMAANVAVSFGQTVLPSGDEAPDEKAWSEYLRFVHEGVYGDFETSIYWLNRTLEVDPGWTVGWATLALFRLQQLGNVGDIAFLEHANAALATAAKDPNQGLWLWAHTLRQAYGYGDFSLAVPIFAGYSEVPLLAQFYPQLAAQLGMNEEAKEGLRRLTEREPNQANYFQVLALNEQLLGGVKRATTAAERMVQLSSTDSYQALHIASLQAAQAGDLARAETYLAAIQDGLSLVPVGSESYRSREGLRRNAAAGIAAAKGSAMLMQPIADAMVQDERYLQAALYLLMVRDDEAAEKLIDEALARPVTLRWGWFVFRSMMPADVRSHPMVLRIEEHLGYTQQLRLALCLDMMQRPKHLGYQCDPSRYQSKSKETPTSLGSPG